MSSEPLAKLAEEFFQASLDSSPTSAIMRGHKKYFDQIEELTDEKFEEEMENVQNFKNSLSNIDLNSLSDKEKVTEENELLPISEYNKTKMVAERIFLSYKDKMNIFCVRPATVCGVSPRMRLDVSVNILTYSALSKGIITVFGGNQIRANLHIDDICDLYIFFINNF